MRNDCCGTDYNFGMYQFILPAAYGRKMDNGK